ncbi:MAG: cytochrome-c oxidase, cbb3-type subunit III [Alphaproteobacteria bacterium]|nr:cytochrome-c oxidase, cbb3-type subunit III [Alphaproteobacteria bacterium]
MATDKQQESHLVDEVETTGHEWDGIQEYNNPLPRWWLYTFYVCIIWSVGYWLLMPTWPLVSDFTRGYLGYSQRASVARDIEEARAAQSVYTDKIEKLSLADIRKDSELMEFAVAGGRSAFGVNCIQCHGSGASGGIAYPNLNDDDWLWGGDIEAIHQTIKFGVRSDHEDTRFGDMPAFLKDEILTASEISDVAEFTLTLSGQKADAASVARGAPIFAEQCAACHGPAGKGLREFGAPNLTDNIWLFGRDKSVIVQTVSNGRAGVMPAWSTRLDPVTVKQLALYIHVLGGGE